LAEARSLKKVRLRVLIISRPEVLIRYGFCQIPNAEHRDFILHDMEAAIVNHNVSLFLEYELRSIGQEWSLGAGWPGEPGIRLLVQKPVACLYRPQLHVALFAKVDDLFRDDWI
jgi:hypothetical protein